MKKLLVLLNVVQFLVVLTLTVPSEADHKKVIAEYAGGTPELVSPAATTATSALATASAAGTSVTVAATSAVATATEPALSTAKTAVVKATTAAAAEAKSVGPRCDYESFKIFSVCRQSEKVVTVGALQFVVCLSDRSIHRVTNSK